MNTYRVIYWYLGDEHVFPRLLEATCESSALTQARRLVACPIVGVELVAADSVLAS